MTMLIPALLLLAQETALRSAPAPAQEPAPAAQAPAQEAEAAPRYVVMYDIADLLADPWSAARPGGEADPARSKEPQAGPGGFEFHLDLAPAETWTPDDPAHPYESAAALIDTLRAFTWPALTAGEQAYSLHKGVLVARLTKPQHAWLSGFLDGLRAPHSEQLRVDARFVQLPVGGAAKLGLERVATTLSGDAAAEFRARVDAADHDELATPSLLTGLAQRATMSILAQVAYVKDWEVKVVQPGNMEIADPVVDVIQEGNVLDLRAVRVGDGLYGLELKSTVAQLQRPIPTRTMRIGPRADQEVEVGVPEVVTASIDAQLRLSSGDLVVLYTPSSNEQDLLVLLSLEVVQLPPAPAAPPRPPRD